MALQNLIVYWRIVRTLRGSTALRTTGANSVTYGQQMLEKQKLKYCFGVTEKQFRITFERARRMQGITGDNLLILLESRYDNVVYRAGLAPTRDAARQLVLHGHLSVNGRRVNIPSCTMRAG